MRLTKLLGAILMIVFTSSVFCFTASAEETGLLSRDASDWVSVDATFKGRVSKAIVSVSDDSLSFGNTAGLWPEMKYTFKQNVAFNINSDRIRYDFTPGYQTGIRIDFYDALGESQSVIMNPSVAGASIDPYSGDIKASSAPLKGELSLKGLKAGIFNGDGYSGKEMAVYANTDGNISITGICISIIGASEKAVEFRTLSIFDPNQTTGTTQGKPETTTKSRSSSTGSTAASSTVKSGGRSSGSYAAPSGTQVMHSNAGGNDNEADGDDENGQETTSGSFQSGAAVSNDATITINPAKAAAQNVDSGDRAGGRRILPLIMLAVGCLVLLTAYLLFFRKKSADQNSHTQL